MTLNPLSNARKLFAIALGTSLVYSVGALAQTDPRTPSGPGQRRPDLPAYLNTNGGLHLPPAEAIGGQRGSLSDVRSLLVNDIVIVGDPKLVPSATLDALIAPWKGRRLSVQDLITLRNDITSFYVERGYINSGAILEEQDISDGVVEILIVEGQLSTVHLSGNKSLSKRYIVGKLVKSDDTALNKIILEDRFRIMLSDPAIRSANARLVPGRTRGSAELHLDVDEAERFFMFYNFANNRSPSVGAERRSLSAGFRNAMASGDLLNGEIGQTEGGEDTVVAYSLPLVSPDLRASFITERAEASVVEEPLNDLDIESSSQSYIVSLTYPLIQNAGNTLKLGTSYSWRKSETSLLGFPFSFSSGALNGETKVQAVRFTHDWTIQKSTRVTALRSTFSFGLDGTQPPDPLNKNPSRDFKIWLGQAQYAQRVGSVGGQVVARLDLQLTKNRLYASEKLSMGGETSVRGYRENQILSDNGVIGSIEYRRPLFDLSWKDRGRGATKNISGSIFVDAGQGWNTFGPDLQQDQLIGLGAGLHWAASNLVNFSVSWAGQIQSVDNPGDKTLEDQGVSFRISGKIF